MVPSDAHQGLTGAISAVLEGAVWQRSRTRFANNLLIEVPRHARNVVKAAVRIIIFWTRPTDVWVQLDRVVD